MVHDAPDRGGRGHPADDDVHARWAPKTFCAAEGMADTLSGWSRACTSMGAPASTRGW